MFYSSFIGTIWTFSFTRCFKSLCQKDKNRLRGVVDLSSKHKDLSGSFIQNVTHKSYEMITDHLSVKHLSHEHLHFTFACSLGIIKFFIRFLVFLDLSVF